MTTQFTQLVTHWHPDEAHSVIEFLDELSALLWKVYGEEIISNQQAEFEHHRQQDEQLNLDFDDPIPF